MIWHTAPYYIRFPYVFPWMSIRWLKDSVFWTQISLNGYIEGILFRSHRNLSRFLPSYSIRILPAEFPTNYPTSFYNRNIFNGKTPHTNPLFSDLSHFHVSQLPSVNPIRVSTSKGLLYGPRVRTSARKSVRKNTDRRACAIPATRRLTKKNVSLCLNAAVTSTTASTGRWGTQGAVANFLSILRFNLKIDEKLGENSVNPRHSTTKDMLSTRTVLRS